MTAKVSKTTRRWLQYSLRSLLLLMLVSAIGSAWLGYRIRQVKVQREAIAKIGGLKAFKESTPSIWPVWLDKWLTAPEVESLCMPARINSDLAPLAELKGVKHITLWDSPVSDLSPLAELTSLEELYASGSKVSDLTPLAKLTNLRELNLSRTNVKDLTSLKKLTNLRTLDLRHTKVVDLSPLANLSNLEDLTLLDTPVSDLSPLTKLSRLQTLSLSNQHITHEQRQQLRKVLPNCVIVD